MNSTSVRCVRTPVRISARCVRTPVRTLRGACAHLWVRCASPYDCARFHALWCVPCGQARPYYMIREDANKVRCVYPQRQPQVDFVIYIVRCYLVHNPPNNRGKHQESLARKKSQ